ncbi:MAG TPA: type I DNA topoisomerase [Gaiella sp.]|uniref:type I DNA topoisomerase n=1 Tax=Gaiella sp. TaxID=2663207 RepID=UPI002D805F6A|nr:type I DNA topoisomerase [Gaiella sp.]HET9288897.1 type I DNA topoisomerase [Gaiella sp.]
MTRLVIVESPAKARTIAGYLGGDFVVESSVGHIRDLPNRASDVPKEQRAQFGKLGVDVENGFQPLYIVDADKKRVVSDLKQKLRDADELLLATDEDREGEAIAWHLREVLKPKVPVRRMVFHEITKDAIERALDQTRDIDERLVDAQETRRILDRLYGFEVSPVLWKKVMPRLSAGRVQSVATRLVVEREWDRWRFVAASYWDVVGTFEPGDFQARLVALDGTRIAQGRDFGEDGRVGSEVLVLDEERARALATALEERPFTVRKVDEKPYTRRPAAPFRTSTLQQEASRKLRFSSQTTMSLAQRLYENGHITYMRTDSVTLSDAALKAARAHAAREHGPETVPDEPRRYERAVANAQEAHEAIRPAGDVFRTPAELARELNRDELALYDLIFKRTIASQMKDAAGQTVSIELGATTTDGTDATFRASGTVITFPGFMLAYASGRDEPTEEDEERRLPALTVGQELSASSLDAQGHETSPPARFTEASLVKALEERGIGRPSTYASIMSTILDRGYVYKKGTALVPTFLAFAVTQLLERHFDQLVDYDFTARLEGDLDRIAAGDEERVEWLKRFYFGDGDPGLHALVTDHLEGIDAREVNSIAIPRSDIVVRVGRYGPYLERGEERASLSEDMAPDELTPERAEELLVTPAAAERSLGEHPETGREIVVRVGRFGPYVTEVLPEGDEQKPRTASLFASMTPETVTLEEAVPLLSLPRTLEGSDGQEIVVSNGRYGPFVKKGSETRSLESEEQLLTLTVQQAEEILAQPKQRRGRGAPKPPLKELGPDPSSGKPLVVKDGRFGPYVTDGETNASLRRGEDVAGLTLERALELLAERRAKGPAQPRRRTRSRR